MVGIDNEGNLREKAFSESSFIIRAEVTKRKTEKRKKQAEA